MLLTGPFAMLSMPSFDFHLPPCMEGFLIHLSPLAIATISLGGTISLCMLYWWGHAQQDMLTVHLCYHKTYTVYASFYVYVYPAQYLCRLLTLYSLFREFVCSDFNIQRFWPY